MSDSNAAMHREAFDLFLDDLIGEGMSRQVFSSKLLPGCVIKVEKDARRFQNIVEWETWQRVKHTPMSKWFAECKSISPNGSILVMERTAAMCPTEYYARMPVFLCDFKRSNYGTVPASANRKGRKGEHFLVCHDYGTNLLFEHGMSKRMRKVTWYDES